MKIALIFLIMIIFMVQIGQMVATAKPKLILVLIGGLVLSTLTIMNLEWGLYILIFVVPFTLQVSLRREVEAGTDDLFLIFLTFSWLANRARTKEDVFVATPLNWPIVLFFISGLISLIPLNLNFPRLSFMIGALHFLKFFEYAFIYFIVVSCIKELPQVKKFMIAFFINVGVVVAIQIIQNLFGGPLVISTANINNIAVRYGVSSFESNAILGAFYSFAIAILIGLILTSSSIRVKVVLTIFSTILSFGLFNTFSRSAYLGIIVGIFIMAMLKKKRLYLILLALFIISPIIMQPAVWSRIAMTVQRLKPTIEFDPSAEVRLLFWKQSFKVFMDNPVFGVGYWGVKNFLGTDAHNQYLAYLADLGIVGFGIFLWLMGRIFKIALWIKNNARDNFTEGLGLGYTAGLAALLTTCFFSESLEAFRMLGTLWFVTGLVVSAYNIILNQTETPQD